MYLTAIKRLHDERAAEMLELGLFSAQGEWKGVQELVKKLRPKKRRRRIVTKTGVHYG